MKTFKTNFNFFMILIALTTLTISCSAEDGMDGIDGQNGIDGIDGTDGVDGMDGQDGQDGAPGDDGSPGADGVDGNANVRVFTYDLTNVSGTFHDQTVLEITQQVLDNDVIIGYVSPINPGIVIPLPAISDNANLRFNISVIISSGIYGLNFIDDTNGSSFSISQGALTNLRVVIIESTSTTSGKSSKENILSELKKAGVDISDYYQVMDYFGMEY